MYHHFLDTLKLTKIIIFDPGYRVKPYYTEFKRGPCAILYKKIKEDVLAKSVTYKKNLPRGRNATDQMCCCCAHSVQLTVRCVVHSGFDKSSARGLPHITHYLHLEARVPLLDFNLSRGWYNLSER